MRGEIERLATQYRFLHWHLAFPDVFRLRFSGERAQQRAGWSGGFFVVLGSPPWEKIKLQEREWFAPRRPDIAVAPSAAAHTRLIKALQADDPALYAAFCEDLRKAEGESLLVRSSGRYPLCGTGDINTSAIFAENSLYLLNSSGRVGIIIPSGIATDNTTKDFFASLVESHVLVSLYDIENACGIFDAVHGSYKFSLMTVSGTCLSAIQAADFVFWAHAVSDLNDESRHFTLSAEELSRLSPASKAMVAFRSKRDRDLTLAIYSRVTLSMPAEVQLAQGTFHSSNDSALFVRTTALGSDGLEPLYEPRMFHMYDHRFGGFDGRGEPMNATVNDHCIPTLLASTRYSIPKPEVDRRLSQFNGTWCLAYLRIASSTDERTLIAAVLPTRCVDENTVLVSSTKNVGPVFLSYLFANCNAFVISYLLLQRDCFSIGNQDFLQLPLFAASAYFTHGRLGVAVERFIADRTLELTYTAWDLRCFASAVGRSTPPFRWDEGRRFLLRCELDALYFYLYGIARDDADYILGAFLIVRRKDEAAYGEYRTKRLILEIYDAMAEAERTGVPYQTRLDPPPADPRVAHVRQSEVR